VDSFTTKPLEAYSMQTQPAATLPQLPESPIDLIERILRDDLAPNEEVMLRYLCIYPDLVSAHAPYPELHDYSEVRRMGVGLGVSGSAAHVHAHAVHEQALSSRVQLVSWSRRDSSHLPFVELAPIEGGVETIVAALGRAKVPPCDTLYLFQSGDTYTLYGDRLLSESEWTYFMGCLLSYQYYSSAGMFLPLVDPTWVAHALMQGFGLIRTHARPDLAHNTGAQPCPTLVHVI
jgi:hypothetical protein